MSVGPNRKRGSFWIYTLKCFQVFFRLSGAQFDTPVGGVIKKMRTNFRQPSLYRTSASLFEVDDLNSARSDMSTCRLRVLFPSFNFSTACLTLPCTQLDVVQVHSRIAHLIDMSGFRSRALCLPHLSFLTVS